LQNKEAQTIMLAAGDIENTQTAIQHRNDGVLAKEF
jgi:hypothetical protein